MRLTTLLSRTAMMYIDKRVSRSAAGLAYFLTMSVFPMLICLNALLGRIFPDPDSIIAFAEGIIPTEAMRVILEYLSYVSAHNNRSMFNAGLILTATSGAAAFRQLHHSIGDIESERRYKGTVSYLMSFPFSLVFLAAVYFAAGVVVSGNWFLRFIDDNIVFISVNGAWQWLRFVLMFALLCVIIYGTYRITSPHAQGLMPGAAAASLGLVSVSIVFSFAISVSVRYPLVYGSLASMVVMMVWLYLCCNLVLLGSIINVVLRNARN